jgi:hypothetical protein
VAVAPIETDRGTVQVEIADPLLTLAERLQEAPEEEEAALALRKADEDLDRLERERRLDPDRHERRRGPIGVEVHLPEGFSSP